MSPSTIALAVTLLAGTTVSGSPIVKLPLTSFTPNPPTLPPVPASENHCPGFMLELMRYDFGPKGCPEPSALYSAACIAECEAVLEAKKDEAGDRPSKEDDDAADPVANRSIPGPVAEGHCPGYMLEMMRHHFGPDACPEADDLYSEACVAECQLMLDLHKDIVGRPVPNTSIAPKDSAPTPPAHATKQPTPTPTLLARHKKFNEDFRDPTLCPAATFRTLLYALNAGYACPSRGGAYTDICVGVCEATVHWLADWPGQWPEVFPQGAILMPRPRAQNDLDALLAMGTGMEKRGGVVEEPACEEGECGPMGDWAINGTGP
ncbi:uncharacterized protein LTR77_008804 [Saxophila tyrrhenica]|uniref:Uncharacterized protein n=1 Tax=Saxophila tyrrhenica TaxID=1690608 RepID=A0AAV9P400_9PEZI|nr:hypothetical protein LTR77_008804 [Saxophila tyrrhenica]